MNETYFEWLLNIVGIDPNDQNSYGMLCMIMQDKLFYPILEMDENRYMDGIRYRWEHAKTQERNEEKAELVAAYLDETLGGCTVLELMISLAERMYWEMEDSRYEADIGKWFRELISNLGLDMYTDRELLANGAAYFEVDHILEKLVFRKYGYSGEGGLFPLQHAEEDQRETEIAIQMNNYLMENYDILD